MKNTFKDLFILDLANNHFGDVNHAKKIIQQFAKVVKKNRVKAAIKFQLRDYETFIHKSYVDSDDRYVRRFLDTKLDILQFKQLFNYVKKNKLLTACTPFDENSVKVIEDFKFDFLKIASVSSGDFRLLKRVVKNKIPKIISTGGLDFSGIDKITRIMKKNNQNFALMHCISIYPSNDFDLQIGFIKSMKRRYPNVPIGWSTHENPDSFLPSSLAKACGAEIFERHIGIKSKKFKLNNYSMQPAVFEKYLNNLDVVKSTMSYSDDSSKVVTKKETITLKALQRGLYAKFNLKKGTILTSANSYLAFPLQKNQIPADQIKNETSITSDIKIDQPILIKKIKHDSNIIKDLDIWKYIHTVKGILNEHKILIGDNFEMEISHHKGIKNFYKVGCYLFNLINKEYAKKIIVMLPNQTHPSHHHKVKNETFHILAGSLILVLDGKKKILKAGDIIDIKKNSSHKFKAGPKGCIFDEISTTSIKSDSYYKNLKIKKMKRFERKTIVTSWV
ncbi:N-acetylneuraminate synthase family protein [Candidatus Pelagibacter sp.]|nr:N-acetylneuraminate synthase family protein [Candidatus Pelagibacter sp.]